VGYTFCRTLRVLGRRRIVHQVVPQNPITNATGFCRTLRVLGTGCHGRFQ
jgi:hypothetical protein